MMNIAEIKNQMMKLWKDTFHDSMEYISLVFDEYFNPDMIEYHIEDGHIVAAMLAVPYEFKLRNESHGGVRGLYLCGLATSQKYRGRNIMSRLIDKINRRAKEMNYDFTFLIPADQRLIKFYSDRGYVPAFYRVDYNYLSQHDFRNEYESNLISYFRQSHKDDEDRNDIDHVRMKFLGQMNYFDEITVLQVPWDQEEICKRLIEYLVRYEKSRNEVTMIHSEGDWETVFQENHLAGGMIFLCENIENNICGAAFVNGINQDETVIPYIVYDDRAVYYKLLDAIDKYIYCSLDNATIDNIDDRENYGSIEERQVYSDMKPEPVILNSTLSDNLIDKVDIDGCPISQSDHDCTCSETKEIDLPDYHASHINHLEVERPERINQNNPENMNGVSSRSVRPDEFGAIVDRKSDYGAREGKNENMVSGTCQKKTEMDEVHKKDNFSYRLKVWDKVYDRSMETALWSPMYVGDRDDEGNLGVGYVTVPSSDFDRLSVYGMLRLLNPVNILKLAAKVTDNKKYSILVGKSTCANAIVIDTNNGNWIVKSNLQGDNEGYCGDFADSGRVEISVKELSEILFRRPNTQKIVSESLGLPSIPMVMALLLD